MVCTSQKELQGSFLTSERPVALFGNGVSGRAAADLLKKKNIPFEIYDENPEKGKRFDLSVAKNHTFAVCSPSFLPQHPWIIAARRAGIFCLSELDLASLWCPTHLVAITGTNGKTTTTTFLTEIFRHQGYRVWSAGNIGTPLSQLICDETLKSEDWIFCEVSSFQAEISQWIKWDQVIWTNFAPNHLDEHQTLQHYFEAKWKLTQQLKGEQSCFFCSEGVEEAARKFHHPLPKQTHVIRNTRRTNSTPFNDYPQRENFWISVAFCEKFSISQETVTQFAQTFHRPKFRLEDLGIVEGNHYWNDAKCTDFAALDSALKNFREPVIWIGGGRSKGEKLASIIPILKKKVELALLIGETGLQLAPLLQNSGIPAVYVKNIESAFFYVKKSCFRGKTIVFSPAFSSFDQFTSYVERGSFFEKCVLRLKFCHLGAQ